MYEFAPQHLSFSALTSYIRCGKAYQLRRLAGAAEHPSWWSIGGSVVHQVTETIDRLTSAGQSVTIDVNIEKPTPTGFDVGVETLRVLDELAEAERSRSGLDPDEWFAGGWHPNKQRYEFWKENAPQMVQRWIDWRAEHNWKIAEFGSIAPSPAIEFEVRFPIPSLGIEFLGYIDRIMVYPSGEHAIVDIKTGSRQPPDVQLGMYANALESMGYERPKYGVFWNARTGKHSAPMPLEKYTPAYVDQHFAQFYAGAKAGTFLPNVYSDFCRTCTVQRACYAFGGDLSSQYDDLDPNYREVQK